MGDGVPVASSYLMFDTMGALGRWPWLREGHDMASKFMMRQAQDPHISRNRSREVFLRQTSSTCARRTFPWLPLQESFLLRGTSLLP